MGTPPCFPTISTKGDNFCDFLFVVLEDEDPPKRRVFVLQDNKKKRDLHLIEKNLS